MIVGDQPNEYSAVLKVMRTIPEKGSAATALVARIWLRDSDLTLSVPQEGDIRRTWLGLRRQMTLPIPEKTKGGG